MYILYEYNDTNAFCEKFKTRQDIREEYADDANTY